MNVVFKNFRHFTKPFRAYLVKPYFPFVYGPLKIALSIFIVCGFNKANAQPVVWADSCTTSSFYGQVISDKNSVISRIENYPGGDIIAVGSVADKPLSTGIPKAWCLVMRMTPTGEVVWSKLIGNANPGVTTEVTNIISAVTRSGDIILALDVVAGSVSGHYAVRLNGAGNFVWTKQLPYVGLRTPSDVMTHLMETSDGNLLLAGTATNDGVVMKLDADGNFVWAAGLTSVVDYAANIRAIAEAPSAYYVGGDCSIFFTSTRRNYIAIIDKETGNFGWVKPFNFSESDNLSTLPAYNFNSMSYTGGMLVLTGASFPGVAAAGNVAQAVVHIGLDGTPVSGKRISNPLHALHPGISQHGKTYHHSARLGVQYDDSGESDLYTYCFNEDFSKKWAWRTSFPGAQKAYDSKLLSNSSLVIGGTSESSFGQSAIILKTTETGKLDGCGNNDLDLVVQPLSFIPVGEPGFHVGLITNRVTENAVLDMIATDGLDWQAQCSSYTRCRMSKMNGQDKVCQDNVGLFSVARSGNFQKQVNFTLNTGAPLTVISDTSASFHFTTEGTFTIYARMTVDCGTLGDSMTVQVTKRGKSFDLGPDQTICGNINTILRAPGGYASYTWQNNPGDSVLTVTQPGEYHLVVTDACGNTFRDSVRITQVSGCMDDIIIPSAFTPNSDGLNDIFKAVSHRPLKKFSFEIYNRWGEKIFETKDIEKGWDGKFKGAVQDQNIFIWKCVYQFEGAVERSKAGTVSLIK